MQRRNTKTKQVVEHILRASSLPLTLAEVFHATKKKLPQTAYSTVFRILKQLENSEDIRTINWRERGKRFEWAGHDHHHHIVCNNCGLVKDIDDRALNFKTKSLSDKTGFKIEDHSIEIFGVCQPCQRQA